MMKLIFATNNKHKLDEILKVIPGDFQIVSLEEIQCKEDIPETGITLEENALQKARFVYDKFNCACFADDTGLEIESLNNEPGVFSARYAGEEKDAEKNMHKVLSNLESQNNRKAKFKTVIALIINNKEFLFKGEVEGVIINKKIGQGGFGYDPIFMPNGFDRTFAEMNSDEKNNISHRGRAVIKLIDFLKNEMR